MQRTSDTEGAVCRGDPTNDSLFLQSIAHFAQLLFVDRMRKPADRQHVAECFERAFGTPGLSTIPPPPCHVAISPEKVQLGWASLPRAALIGERTHHFSIRFFLPSSGVHAPFKGHWGILVLPSGGRCSHAPFFLPHCIQLNTFIACSLSAQGSKRL